MIISQKDDKLKLLIKSKLEEFKINDFFNFSLLENTESILINGILSKNEAKKICPECKSFADESVQNRRSKKTININCGPVSIHDLVPAYLTSQTPTLYSRKDVQDNIFFMIINPFIIMDDEIEFAFSDGNAAAAGTNFYCDINKLSEIPWKVIEADYWPDWHDGKRKRNAEFLIYPKVPVKYIKKIVVNNENSKKYIDEITKKLNINFEIENQPSYFF